MGKVRECQIGDIGEVAQLWAQEFHKRTTIPMDSVSHYFKEMFFANPWCTAELPSLIYESASGKVVGFLGVVPREMRYRGERIQVAVASQLMMDSSKARGFAALELLRRFFAGPQDLAYSDGTNDLARKVWVACGGSIAMLYSSVWTRVLRPTQYLMDWCRSHKRFSHVAQTTRPFSRALDAIAIRMKDGPYWLLPPEGSEEEPSEEELLWCIRHFCGERVLQPSYDLSSFHWLLKRASEQSTHGDFCKGMIRDEKEEIIGWYLYYVRPGGIAQVLQFGGKCHSIGQVLNHLFYRAWQQGAVAVSGQMEPNFALELSQNRCRFSWPGGTVVHSRNQKLLDSIYRGDAILTRLDGEWWMRFCDLSEGGSGRKYSSSWEVS